MPKSGGRGGAAEEELPAGPESGNLGSFKPVMSGKAAGSSEGGKNPAEGGDGGTGAAEGGSLPSVDPEAGPAPDRPLRGKGSRGGRGGGRGRGGGGASATGPKLTPKDVKTTADDFAAERARADKKEYIAYVAFHFKKMREATQDGAAPLTTLTDRNRVQQQIEDEWYKDVTVPTMAQWGVKVDKEIMLSAGDTDAVAALLDSKVEEVEVGDAAVDDASSAFALLKGAGAVDLGLEPAVEVSECAMCGKKGRSNAPWVQCDECDGWFHCSCVGVNSRAIQKLRWVCVTCDDAVDEEDVGDEGDAMDVNAEGEGDDVGAGEGER